MSNSMHDSTRQTITLPTRHPKWCDVVSHQGTLDEILDINPVVVDTSEIQRARQHWAMAGEHARISVVELRAGHDDHSQEYALEEGGYWNITLEQQPNIDDIDGGSGQPFISLCTTVKSDILTITSGEARVLAAQLVAAADKIDLS
jgi:hypothetical protein